MLARACASAPSETPSLPQQPATSPLELRVCTNRTCRKQGSVRLADAARVLAPVLKVTRCGCLGQCGAGPNLVCLPSGVAVSHVSSLDHLAALLQRQYQLDASDTEARLREVKRARRAGVEPAALEGG